MRARVTGNTDTDLLKLPFKAVYAFRPGYIKPTPGLQNALLFSKVLAPLYPALHALLPKYMCTLEEVGLAMVRVATTGYPKKVLENEDITSLAKKRT
jgi:hypothetical protein